MSYTTEEKDDNFGGQNQGPEEELVIEEDSDSPADMVKSLREKLKKCRTEKEEYLAGWQRAKADFVNARKEEEERRKDIIKFSEKNLLLEMIDLADSFDRLFANKEAFEKIDNNWRQGIEYLRAQLLNIMKGRGVEPIETAGKMFDPKESESIGNVDVDKREKEGMVMEEMRRGYRMHGAVIRPSLVKVGKFISK
ncbi:nucleotide exchange factor GrpE [Candidatus Parcubacteria bacterium]|nr:MAG: nucleotide exchange factor GrpE [Candidatus Parcubacteria bacterium]